VGQGCGVDNVITQKMRNKNNATSAFILTQGNGFKTLHIFTIKKTQLQKAFNTLFFSV